MVQIKKKQFGIPYSYYWLEDPSPASAFRAVHYNKCATSQRVFGFVRGRRAAHIIDLTPSPETLLKNMSKDTAYKIRRAKREGVTVRVVDDPEEFQKFFNEFALTSARSLITTEELARLNWGEETVGLAAMHDGKVLVMHADVVDQASGRACNLYSATQHRGVSDSKARNFIAMANRLLHYEAMLLYKARNLKLYDLGDYLEGATDPKLLSIYKFKSSFGIRFEEHTEYYSFPMLCLVLANKLKDAIASRISRTQEATADNG